VNRLTTVTLAAIGALTLGVSACAETVVDVEAGAGADAPDGDGTIAATTTVPIVGTATELLPELSAEMSRLSAQISGDGDERATLRQIEEIWVVAQPEVEVSRPDLVGGIQTTVDMARNAVVRVRPADADKAFSILTDLVDRYTGDG
jgi:hypothetical protein